MSYHSQKVPVLAKQDIMTLTRSFPGMPRAQPLCMDLVEHLEVNHWVATMMGREALEIAVIRMEIVGCSHWVKMQKVMSGLMHQSLSGMLDHSKKLFGIAVLTMQVDTVIEFAGCQRE